MVYGCSALALVYLYEHTVNEQELCILSNSLTWEEFDALRANGTWTLAPRPPHTNIISGKWLFKNKLNPNGTLEWHKARWVVRGLRPGANFHQTFSLVVKPATIRTVLHLAAN